MTQKNIKERFLKFIQIDKEDILSIYGYAIFSGIIALSLPIGIQAIVGLLFGNKITTSIVVLILAVLIGVLLNGYLQILQMKLTERIQQRVFTRYALETAHMIPRIKLSSIESYYLPELSNRFLDTAFLQKGITKILLEFPAASIQIMFGLILLSFYHPFFIFFGLVLVALLYLIFYFTGPRGIKSSIEESDYKYAIAFWLQETARVMKSFKLMNQVDYPSKKTDILLQSYLNARDNHFKILKFQYWAFILFKLIITGSLLMLGTALFIEQKINLGQFIASEIIIIMVLSSVEKIISSLDNVYDFLTSLEKVEKILDKPLEYFGKKQILINEKLDISLQNISFQYGEEPPVLSNVNLDFKHNSKTIIMGKQGAGKTTLLQLISGAYIPKSGSILVSDNPLSIIDIQDYRNRIGFISNTTELFNDTIKNNITLGDNSIEDKYIIELSKEIGLWEYLNQLPKGLETPIESMGRKIPETVAQKIIILRALAGKPEILLIENNWSAMSKEDRANIFDLITSKKYTQTVIAISNDIEFAEHCTNFIYVSNTQTQEFKSKEDAKTFLTNMNG